MNRWDRPGELQWWLGVGVVVVFHPLGVVATEPGRSGSDINIRIAQVRKRDSQEDTRMEELRSTLRYVAKKTGVGTEYQQVVRVQRWNPSNVSTEIYDSRKRKVDTRHAELDVRIEGVQKEINYARIEKEKALRYMPKSTGENERATPRTDTGATAPSRGELANSVHDAAPSTRQRHILLERLPSGAWMLALLAATFVLWTVRSVCRRRRKERQVKATPAAPPPFLGAENRSSARGSPSTGGALSEIAPSGSSVTGMTASGEAPGSVNRLAAGRTVGKAGPDTGKGCEAAPATPSPSQEAAKKPSGAPAGDSLSVGDALSDVPACGSSVSRVTASGAAAESADHLASGRTVEKAGADTGEATPSPLTSSTVQSRSASPSKGSTPAPSPPVKGVTESMSSSSISSTTLLDLRTAASPKVLADEEAANLMALGERRAGAKRDEAAVRGAAKAECGVGAEGCEAAPATPSPPQEAAKKPSGAPVGDSLSVGDALSDVPVSGSSVPRVTASGAAAESADRPASGRTVEKVGADTGEGCEAAPATPPPSQEAVKKPSGAPAGDSLSVGDALSDVPACGSSVPRVTASGAAVKSADRPASDRTVEKAGADTGEAPPLASTPSAVRSRSASPSGLASTAPSPPAKGVAETSSTPSATSSTTLPDLRTAAGLKVLADEEAANLMALGERRAGAKRDETAVRGAAKAECGVGAEGCEAAPAKPSPSQEAAKKPSGAPAGDSLSVGDALSDVPASGSSVPRVTASGAAVKSADRLASGRTVEEAGTDTGEAPPLISTPSVVRSRSASPSGLASSAPSPPTKGVAQTSSTPSIPSPLTSLAKPAGRRKAARPKKVATDEEAATLQALRQRRAEAKQEKAATRGAAKAARCVGAEEGESAPAPPPPPQEAAKKPTGALAGDSPPVGDALPDTAPSGPSARGVTVSGAAAESADRVASHRTVGKAGPDTGKRVLPPVFKETPLAIGVLNQPGKNKCPLIAVLQLVRHMSLVVAMAIGSHHAFNESNKAFEEASKSSQSPALAKLSRKERRRQQAKDKPEGKPEKTFMAALGSFFTVVAKKKAGGAVDAPPGLSTFLSGVDGFNEHQQADAAEVLTTVLSLVVSEAESDKPWEDEDSGETSLVPQQLVDAFRGKIISQSICGCKVAKAESEGGPIPEPCRVPQDLYVLPLAMPSAPKDAHEGLAAPALHLIDLLGKYFEDEHGLDPCVECKGGANKDFKKSRSITLAKPPGRLFLHLKRFEYLSGFGGAFGLMKKLENLVKLPVELDMAPYMAGAEGKVLYDLDGIVHHATDTENPQRGHYSTYVRLGGDRWRCYNDAAVTTCSMDDTIAAGALIASYTMRT